MVIKELSVLMMLIISSLEDIKNRQISVKIVSCFAAEGILCWIFIWKLPIAGLPAAIVPGIMVLALSCFTKGAIGMGDGVIIMVAGVFLGASRILEVFVCAVFLSACFALILYIIMKKSRKYEIPFVPFVLISFVVEMMWK